uniref:MULE transposase domain-containing protein n=1 Tax=Moniliophthora roreri TaxID=221103 RepID=A0A0W0FE87_MONRR
MTTIDRDEESEDASEDDTLNPVTHYANAEAMFTALCEQCHQGKTINFHGEYTLPVDALVSDKERVQIIMREAWQVTGYRFTVKYHPKMKTGHKTWAWCSQDADWKKVPKPKQGENKGNYAIKLITLWIRHHDKHVPYYDVGMPTKASQIICENLEWCTPSSLVPEIQAMHLNITTAQVHRAWALMSKELWKKDPRQIESARKLLKECQDIIDIFEIEKVPGVEQHVVIEIAMDATYNMNTLHLELYCIMAKYDNAGFPLSYCLQSTTVSAEPKKKIDVLECWTVHLHDRYHVNPKFVHLDKDLGEIGMACKVWLDAQILICGWHMNKAVKERISKAKLLTTLYKASDGPQTLSIH